MLIWPPPAPPHVRRVAARFHLKFFHGVGRRTQILRVEGRIGIGRAVQQEKVRIRAAAADDNGGALSRAPVKRIRRSGLRAKTHVRAGNGEHQVYQHSSIQRQLADGLRLDDFPNAGIGGVQHLTPGQDLHALLDRTDVQVDGDGELLPNFHANRLHTRREARGFRSQLVVVRQQRPEFRTGPVGW